MGKYKYKAVNKTGGSCFVPPHSEFYLDYEKGERVKAKKGTLGIMVFPTRAQAITFLSSESSYRSWLDKRIKRVIPVGEATTPNSVSSWPEYDADIKTFNRMSLEQRRHDKYCTAPPLGTECYSEVIVVD